jgi:hypothetical protein
VLLGYGDLIWIPVSCAAGGEDDLPHSFLAHYIENVERFDNVVAEIQLRGLHRFAYVGESGKVDDGLNGILPEYLPERLPVGDISLHQRTPLYVVAVTSLQVVDDDGFQPGARQDLRCVAANVAGSAGNQDVHIIHYS